MARGGPGWRPHRRRPEELAPSCATVPHAQIEPRGQRAGRAEEPHGAAARAPAQTQASRGGCLLSREGGKRSGTEEGGPGGEGRLGRGRDARGRPSGQAPQPAAAVGQRYRATKKGARPTLCINLQIGGVRGCRSRGSAPRRARVVWLWARCLKIAAPLQPLAPERACAPWHCAPLDRAFPDSTLGLRRT